MSWQIKYHDQRPYPVKVGDMWPTPELVNHQKGDPRNPLLSPRYFREWADKRPPLFVCLPDKTWFCVDAQASGGSDGWQVTGQPPNITVFPSINIVGCYHGWINNGVITDDCEGRIFPES